MVPPKPLVLAVLAATAWSDSRAVCTTAAAHDLHGMCYAYGASVVLDTTRVTFRAWWSGRSGVFLQLSLSIECLLLWPPTPSWPLDHDVLRASVIAGIWIWIWMASGARLDSGVMLCCSLECGHLVVCPAVSDCR